MNKLTSTLLDLVDAQDSPLVAQLADLVSRPTGRTSAGYPYFERQTFEDFRDTIPLLFSPAAYLLEVIQTWRAAIDDLDLDAGRADNLRRGTRVARQIFRTAAITAPTDLWLTRHILGTHRALGLTERLLDGQAIDPRRCTVDGQRLDAEQLAIDLHFLLSRGYLEAYDQRFRIAGHPRVRRLFEAIPLKTDDEPIPATAIWRPLLTGDPVPQADLQALASMLHRLQPHIDVRPPTLNTHWVPSLSQVCIGYLLVPLVLSLRAAELTHGLQAGQDIDPTAWLPDHPDLRQQALHILSAAGWLRLRGQRATVTALGARGFQRGPGPFGIIQTYHPYMKAAAQILRQGTGEVWVRRGENVGASQDANRKTFRLANQALDDFCEQYDFQFDLFIEHAIGRGEATRQRFNQDGEDHIRYVGADLEDPAIDAAQREQQAGRLPQNMLFIRQADIGNPRRLLDALHDADLDPNGAVMLVGNGFHEVRNQDDHTMAQVFEGYHDAGILLLFTEENALSIDDLRATAFNTYHAGFKYVHEKSGQCLRPADPRPEPRLGPPLRAAWSECARMAGYVRLNDFCTRTRTIYPYPRPDGHNPSISVNHFFIPRPLADKLGISP